MVTQTISIQTADAFSCHSITREVQCLVDQSGIKEGVVNVFSRHTTTALIVNEMEEKYGI